MQLTITNGLLTLLQWPHFQMVMMLVGYALLMTAFIISHKRHEQTMAKVAIQYKKLFSQFDELDKSTQQLCNRLKEFNTSDRQNNYAINAHPSDVNKIAEQQIWQITSGSDNDLGSHTNWINWTDIMRLTADDESLALDLIAQLVNEIPKVTQALEQTHTLTYQHRGLIHQWLGLFRMTGIVRMSEKLEGIKNKLLNQTDQISLDDKECLIADLRDLLVEAFMLIKHNASVGHAAKKLA